MRKNAKKLGLGIMIPCLLLSGCNDAGYNEVKNIESVVSEDTVTDYSSLSDSDKQSIVYQQVSNRKLIDLKELDSITAEENANISKFTHKVINTLEGKVKLNSDDYVVDENVVSYVQWLFQRTPYKWEEDGYMVKGIDNATSSVVVDVTFKSKLGNKKVKPKSSITLGSDNYSSKLEQRQSLWNSYLDAKYGGYGTSDAGTLLAQFKKRYGSVDSVMDEQSTESLASKVSRTGQQYTYKGLINNDYEKQTATMTIRLIIEPTISVGIKTGYTCKHLYVTKYNLQSDFTSTMKEYISDDSKIMQDKVSKKIYSYLNCVDEHNFTGLCSLIANFDELDKHYRDYFNSAFSKNSGYSVTLTDVTENTVSCILNVTKKERGMGTNMTYPCYTDKYYVTFKFKKDDIYITDIILISSEIQSEPTIKDEAVEEGFNAIIELTNEDKMKIEEQLANFAVMQLKGNYVGEEFYSTVDSSLSVKDISRMKETLGSIKGTKKVLWLNNYTSGKDGHASVICKEAIQKEDSSIVECSTSYDLLYMGNKWLVSNYEISSIVKLDSTSLADMKSLFIASSEKVEKFESQVVAEAKKAEEEKKQAEEEAKTTDEDKSKEDEKE